MFSGDLRLIPPHSWISAWAKYLVVHIKAVQSKQRKMLAAKEFTKGENKMPTNFGYFHRNKKGEFFLQMAF